MKTFVVAAGLAEKCEIQVAYAIGVAEPVSVFVETFGTNTVPNEKISERLRNAIDLRPRAIIERLQLLDPSRVQYLQTARNGHFGHARFPWEQTDLVDKLQ